MNKFKVGDKVEIDGSEGLLSLSGTISSIEGQRCTLKLDAFSIHELEDINMRRSGNSEVGWNTTGNWNTRLDQLKYIGPSINSFGTPFPKREVKI